MVVVLNVTTLVSELVPKDINFTEPLICRSPELPEIMIVSFPNCPILTSLSANTSTTGKPAIVLTENRESDKSSEISNRRPLFPSTAKTVVFAVEPEPSTMRTSAPPFITALPVTFKLDPSKVRLVSALAALALVAVKILLSAQLLMVVKPGP